MVTAENQATEAPLPAVTDRIRAALDALNERGLDALDEYMALYHEDVYFEDPIQQTHGREALHRAMRRMFTSLRDIHFRVDELTLAADAPSGPGDEQAFMVWSMRFRTPVGFAMTIEGSSHLRLREGLIRCHRDYWDMLSSLAESSPTLGLAYRSLMRLLA